MAIITEEPDSPQPRLRKPKPKPKPNSEPNSPPPQLPSATKPAAVPTANPFPFWFYFTLIVSLITLSCVLLSSLSPQNPRTWFLNLPPILRAHYSNGRTIKVQTAPSHPQIELFSIQQGPISSDSRVLIVHGLGCSSFAFKNVVKHLAGRNIHTVAIDLPGSGFSDKSIAVVEEIESGGGLFGGLWDVYEEIKEKGLFWGFDQLVEQGYVDFEENSKINKVRVLKIERIKAIELGSEEMGRVLTQVVDSMELSPVDLVLHDSALVLSSNWISENRDLIRSLVILDGSPSDTALPVWVLGVPVVREVVLGFRFVFERVLGKCCMASVGGVEAEGHRILLKGRDGVSAVFGMGKKLNYSFDLLEWSKLDGVKGLPARVIWSDKWLSEGREVADAIPQAEFVTHSGGRWTQEHNAEEVADSIYEFVASLPKSTRKVEEETMRNHSREVLTGATSSDQQQHHHQHGGHGHDHHHGHGHDHGPPGYMDAYGMGQGWAV